MAKIASKGGLLKITISASLTTIAQLNEINTGESANEVLDVPSLDDSGVANDKLNTGATTQADITANGYFDPDLATDQFITDTIALGAASFPIACSIVVNTATPRSHTFNAVGFGMSMGMSVGQAVTKSIRIMAKNITWYT